MRACRCIQGRATPSARRRGRKRLHARRCCKARRKSSSVAASLCEAKVVARRRPASPQGDGYRKARSISALRRVAKLARTKTSPPSQPMKNKLRTLLACIAALAICGPLTAFAATKKSSSSAAKPSSSPAISPSPAAKAAPSPTPSAPTTRPISFHGMISAVDQKAKTFTIAGKQASRVFKVTERTFLSKAGMPATMKDVVVNEEARGSYWKAADGTLEAKKVKLGPMTEAEKARAEKKKS